MIRSVLVSLPWTSCRGPPRPLTNDLSAVEMGNELLVQYEYIIVNKHSPSRFAESSVWRTSQLRVAVLVRVQAQGREGV